MIHIGVNKRWINFCLRKSFSHKVNNPYRHAACLVRGGRLLKYGTNSTKAGCLIDPVYEYRQFHAELAVLCELDPDEIRGSTLYIAGWSRGNNILVSKPCKHCQEYIRKFDLKAVYYSLPDGTYEKYVI